MKKAAIKSPVKKAVHPRRAPETQVQRGGGGEMLGDGAGYPMDGARFMDCSAVQK